MNGVRIEANRKINSKTIGTKKGFRCSDSNIYNSLSKCSLRATTRLFIIKCRLIV